MSAEIIDFKPRRVAQLQRVYNETGTQEALYDVAICRMLEGRYELWPLTPELEAAYAEDSRRWHDEHHQRGNAQQQWAL